MNSYKEAIRMLEEVSVSSKGEDRVQLLRTWLVSLQEIERQNTASAQNNEQHSKTGTKWFILLQEVPRLVERMVSLMCVDIDLNSDDEDADNVDDNKLTVVEIVEREFEKVKKEGYDAVTWLELEDLNIDDDIFVSLDLPTKFPNNSYKELPLPPGPYPWPLVGNLFQIGKNAHIRLDEMAQVHGPLILLRLGQRIVIVGSSSSAASEILKTHDQVLSGRDVSRLLQGKESTVHNMNLVFTSETDDGWRKIWNLYMSNIFSSKAMESRAQMREKKVIEMLNYIVSKGDDNSHISITDLMLVTATNIIGNTFLSMDLVDFEGNVLGAGIKDSVRRLSSLATQPQLADLYPIFGAWDLLVSHPQTRIWRKRPRVG
ncbi:hypothetical protein LXL04_035820 [Taraxacum kok-saghyz]